MAENKEESRKDVRKVMISSTAIDLPLHRDQVMKGCLRQGMFPHMMEDLPPNDAEAIAASLKMVDEADIYIGVFAHRYGYVPKESNPDHISITEMEYNRSVERNIPRLIFVIEESHPITIKEVEQGAGAKKLKVFLDRVKTSNIVKFFVSPEDLRGHVVHGLSELRVPDLGKFHPPSLVPDRAETYIAHPYTLLQTHGLVGRHDELNLLTDWVAKPDAEIFGKHVLNIVAIGGMGKSALTWKWFNEIAPEEIMALAGRMWWSFYESDASFENFVIRALAYVSGRPIEEISQMPLPERESELLAALDHEAFLIVLDGLERELIAYAGMEAARLKDSEVEDQKSKRKTIDPRAGSFLKKLANVKKSRILISTRLFPEELENDGGNTLPGVSRINLDGLTEDDAIALWRAFGVSGSRDLLTAIFDSIERHPLLIQALAGEVNRYKKAPGDFEKWCENNRHFDPAGFRHVQDAMAHVMEYALKDVGEKTRQVLVVIAAFRMPTSYDTLTGVLIGQENPCGSETELDEILVELEDRGLIGWDKRANRYDLHPIVRGVVWDTLSVDIKQNAYSRLQKHFEAVPMIEDWKNVESLTDLTPAIELYNTLIGMGRYEEACDFFYTRLSSVTAYRLSANRQRVELLEMLFPDGLDKLPRLSHVGDQAFTLGALSRGYHLCGQPGKAVPVQRNANSIDLEGGRERSLGIGLQNLSDALLVTGGLRESEDAALRALGISRVLTDHGDEAISLYQVGVILAARGKTDKSRVAIQLSTKIFQTRFSDADAYIATFYLAQRALWLSEFDATLKIAVEAEGRSAMLRADGYIIRSRRIQGAAMLGLNDLLSADKTLHDVLSRARTVNLIEEELPTLISLAELRQRQGDEKAAREFLDDIWEFAERGPYPLLHADALNVLAQIERDAGNTKEAIEAATKAYKLAWCDGPPYAYHWGLVKAQKHLEELGAPLPEMPPFDESKYEPMPEVEIDPR